jgi:cell division protein DivIC
MKKFLRISFRILKNKYVLALLIFFVWLLVFDRNNLIDRYKYHRELKQMEAEKEYYLNKIEVDSKKLNELKTNDANLEKFAREQYLMKKPNEDIYLIVEED